MTLKAMPLPRIAIASAIAATTLLFAAPSVTATGATPADPAKARVAFQACAACHSDKAGVTRWGQASRHLRQTRSAGEGLSYSPASQRQSCAGP